MRLQRMATYSPLIIVAMIFSWAVHGQDVTLHIVDQHGKSLKNAVVELVNSGDSKASSPLPVLVMDQINKQFSPTLLIAQQGQQVNFPNSDNIRHHVYSFSQAKHFQLKLYSGQPESPITFENQGVVVLGCNIHDSMVGYIYVAKSTHVYQSDEQGNVQLTGVTLPAQLSVWHPMQTRTLEEPQALSITENSAKTLQVELQTTEPAPRNTFGDKFKGGND